MAGVMAVRRGLVRAIILDEWWVSRGRDLRGCERVPVTGLDTEPREPLVSSISCHRRYEWNRE